MVFFHSLPNSYILGKSITPPPEFEEVDKNSGSRTTTLKSPSKLKSVLSFRKEKP